MGKCRLSLLIENVIIKLNMVAGRKKKRLFPDFSVSLLIVEPTPKALHLDQTGSGAGTGESFVGTTPGSHRLTGLNMENW